MIMRSAGNKACGHGTGGGLEWLEAEFLCRDAELDELGLVNPDGVVVGLGGVVDAVPQVLDAQILVLDGLLHLALYLLHQLRLQRRVLHQLMQLRLLLLQLLQLRLQLPRKHHVIHFRMLLDLVGQLIELILEVLSVQYHFIILFAEFSELFLYFDDLLANGDEFAFVILSTHLMLFELAKERFEFVPLQTVLLEGILELIVRVAQFEYLFLVFFGFFVDAFDFCFVFLDEFEVVACDLIVVILKFCKGLFMIAHELVYVKIFSLLEFVDFYALLQFEFLLHACKFGLVILLHFEELIVVALHHEGLLALMVLLSDFGLFYMFFFLINEVLLQVLFALLHILHAVLIVLILFKLSLLSILVDAHVGLLLFVLKQLQFLQEDLDLCVMGQLHVLSFGLAVKYLCFEFLDFELCVVVKLFDHVAVHLDVVTLGLDLSDLLLVELEVAFQLWCDHLHELVIRFLLLLLLLGRHTNISYILLGGMVFK